MWSSGGWGRTNRTNEDVKRSTLDVRRAAEVDEFYVTITIEDYVLILDVAMHDLGFGVQEVHCLSNLDENLAALFLFHVDAELDVVEQVHARETVGYHLNVVVDIVFEEVSHLDNIRMLISVSSKEVEHVNL